MLPSIHPLGERARHNRWSITVTAFVIGAVGAGAAAGGLMGWSGGLLPAGDWRWFVAGVLVLAAGEAGLAGIRPPGSGRQSPAVLLGAYRGWVVGLSLGALRG